MSPKPRKGYEKVVTLACVNFNPVYGDKQATLEKMKANIVEAAAQGCNIIAFPELAIKPPKTKGPDHCRLWHEMAETVPGPAAEFVADLARKHNVYVLFGMPEKDRTRPDTYYNAVAIVGPEGVMGSYRKLHLGTLPWVTEGICFTPGTELPVWETRYGPIGVQICYDFWFNPELTRILALKGARLIINCCGTFAGPAKREYMLHVTVARGIENLVYTASANSVGGPELGNSSWSGADLVKGQRANNYLGHSLIAGPAFPRFNHVYAEAGDTEEIISATLNFEKLERWKAVFPWKEWRSSRLKPTSELIAREFKSLAKPG